MYAQIRNFPKLFISATTKPVNNLWDETSAKTTFHMFLFMYYAAVKPCCDNIIGIFWGCLNHFFFHVYTFATPLIGQTKGHG